MKKFTTIALIALLATGILTLTYCSKDFSVDPAVNQSEFEQMTEADFAVMNKLVAFRDKVQYFRKNPGYKSGEVLTPEDAVWNLESLFNASYGFPDEQYGRTKCDTAVLYIDINSNGDVLLDDVITLYDDIITMVTQFYYNTGYNQKGFLLLNLTQGETTNGQMEIGLRSVTGEKGEWKPFGLDDYWWYGELKGDCNWNIGYNETDAAKKIQEAIMNNKPLVYPPPGYRFIYSVYEDINRFGHEYMNENNEYLIFYIENSLGTFTWEEKCLDPDEMNFHYFGESTVIYNILPVELNKPANWTFMSCLIEGKEEANPNNNYIPCIHHDNTLTYALRHLVPAVVMPPSIEL